MSLEQSFKKFSEDLKNSFDFDDSIFIKSLILQAEEHALIFQGAMALSSIILFSTLFIESPGLQWTLHGISLVALLFSGCGFTLLKFWLASKIKFMIRPGTIMLYSHKINGPSYPSPEKVIEIHNTFFYRAIDIDGKWVLRDLREGSYGLACESERAQKFK